MGKAVARCWVQGAIGYRLGRVSGNEEQGASYPAGRHHRISRRNMAGSEMMSTRIEVFKLGIAGLLIPFASVFQPALLLEGDLLLS